MKNSAAKPCATDRASATHEHAHTHLQTYTQIHTHTHTHTQTGQFLDCVHIQTNTKHQPNLHTHTHTHTCKHIYIDVYANNSNCIQSHQSHKKETHMLPTLTHTHAVVRGPLTPVCLDSRSGVECMQNQSDNEAATRTLTECIKRYRFQENP